MRLIDAEILYNRFAELESIALTKYKEATSKEERCKWNTIHNERIDYKLDILYAPIIDAVEVVRCKDCKNYGSFNGEDESCCSPCADSYFKVAPDDYCSRGERIDKGRNE